MSKSVLWLLRILSAAVFFLTCYLGWISLSGANVIGCGSASGCQEVLNGRWAYWLGIPVSALAAGVYALLLVALGSLKPAVPLREQGWRWQAILACSVWIGGAAAWFTAVQIWLIHRICPLCLTAHALGVFLLLLVAFSRGKAVSKKTTGKARLEKAGKARIATAPPIRTIVGATAGFILLVTGQVLFPKATYRIAPLSGGVTDPGPSVGGRKVTIFNGQFTLAIDEFPSIGPTNARDMVISMFDYTCSGCRILHSQLTEAQQTLSNRFSIFYLPVPLEKECNPTVKEVFPEHANACRYARVALAVWKVDPAKFKEFDQWIFAPPVAPALDDTIAYAGRLVGEKALQEAIKDSRIDEQLRAATTVYAATYQQLGAHALPQLIVGTNVAVGNFTSMEVLYQVLLKRFHPSP